MTELPNLLPADNTEELYDSIDMFASESPYNASNVEWMLALDAISEIRFELGELFEEIIILPAKRDTPKPMNVNDEHIDRKMWYAERLNNLHNRIH